MKNIEYIHFTQVNPDEFLEILNDALLRKHLVAHAVFDTFSIREWMDHKIQIIGVREQYSLILETIAL